MKSISILLVDDHQLILELISENLEATNAFSVTCAASLSDAYQKIAEEKNFDIIMLDIVLPEAVGLNEVKKIVDLNSNGKVVIFSGTVSETFVQNCLDVGISGFIPKTFSVDALSSALKFIATGQKFVPANFFTFGGGRIGKDSYGIADGEFEVLKKLAEGLSNKDITNILGLPETTIKMRVRSVCHKLGAENRTQAVLIAQKSGLV
ncbi:MAG: response regulator transcription factor [Pelagibaca sp.]